jgi:hypothetical protein
LHLLVQWPELLPEARERLRPREIVAEQVVARLVELEALEAEILALRSCCGLA